MAIVSVVAVLDKGAEAYMTPVFFVTDAVAIRDFLGEAKNANSMFNRHPQDFSLYKFGVFDDNTGKFDLFGEPKFLVSALHAQNVSEETVQ